MRLRRLHDVKLWITNIWIITFYFLKFEIKVGSIYFTRTSRSGTVSS